MTARQRSRRHLAGDLRSGLFLDVIAWRSSTGIGPLRLVGRSRCAYQRTTRIVWGVTRVAAVLTLPGVDHFNTIGATACGAPGRFALLVQHVVERLTHRLTGGEPYRRSLL